MAYPEDLPGTPVNPGDLDHISDHEKIRVALNNLDNREHSHVTDTTDAHDASAISVVDEFANSNSTNVQDVLDDLDQAITDTATSLSAATNAHLADTSDAHDASAISVVSAGFDGNLAPADDTVQKALQKLDDLALGSGGSTPTIEDEGAALPQRSSYNFTGTGVSVSDVGGKTVFNIPGAGVGTVTGTRVVNVQDYGIVPDAVQITVNVTSAANAVVTCTASSKGTANVFSPSDVGKHMHLDHNGTVVKAWTKLTIQSYVSPTQVVLSGAFGSAMNGVNAIFMTNNTAAIGARLAALQENQTLFWPAAPKGQWYFTDGGHIWTQPNTKMQGEGTRSGIITTNTTNYIFRIRESYQDVEDLAFTHAALYTPGVAGGGRPTYGTSSALAFELIAEWAWGGGAAVNCAFSGFYVGFNIILGIGYNIHRCSFGNHSVAGVSIMNYGNPDSGSFRVFGCDFYTDPVYNGGALCGIRVHTAGGVWLDGCHFFRGEYGILAALFGNPSTNLRITNHSFEDYNDSAGTNPVIASELAAVASSGITGYPGSAICLVLTGSSDFLHSVVISNNNLNTIFGGPGIILGGAGQLDKGSTVGNAGSTSGVPIQLVGNSPTNWMAGLNQTGSAGSQVAGSPHASFKVVT